METNKIISSESLEKCISDPNNRIIEISSEPECKD